MAATSAEMTSDPKIGSRSCWNMWWKLPDRGSRSR
jgi:hypothetical protein